MSVYEWYDFRPASEVVYTCQQMGETLARWKWTHQVDMDVCKLGVLRGELANGSGDVLVNL